MKYCTILILLLSLVNASNTINKKSYFYGYDDDSDIDKYSNIDYRPNTYNKRKADDGYIRSLTMSGAYGSDYDRSKMITDDNIALVSMRINYNYTEFINKYSSKNDAMLDLQSQLSNLFFIDVVRINVTNVISGSVIANFTLFPRISTTDILTIDLLTKYNNGYYTENAQSNVFWLTSSTITYTIVSPYNCNNTDTPPNGFMCVYNYTFTIVPEPNTNITSQYVLTLVLSLVLGGAVFITILSTIRWCMNKTKDHVVKRQRVQLAVREITANYV